MLEVKSYSMKDIKCISLDFSKTEKGDFLNACLTIIGNVIHVLTHA